ncbi:type II secretion system protein [Candidatus Peregrinibacteria bacterium]|nr:type II secretion system protein [Candidatus Peregrinibacteria bacterium]MBI3816649.1 type II secretion system protein [Candidatus Peregrinibacteria bacterium]
MLFSLIETRRSNRSRKADAIPAGFGRHIFHVFAVHAGFTLIELLLVIGIIAILASVVIVAINPTRQLAGSRNAQRQSNIHAIINGVYQYAIDKSGIPSTITTTVTPICKTGVYMPACVSLGVLSGTYLVSIPTDPQQLSSSGFTGYLISKDTTTSRVTVSAHRAENGITISVSR